MSFARALRCRALRSSPEHPINTHYVPAILPNTYSISMTNRPTVRSFTSASSVLFKQSNLAVVGGGAAGFYTAARILAKTTEVNIDIYEKLPTPYGLVRYGVAPDHPEVKNCMGKFDEVAADPRVRLLANVSVGNINGSPVVHGRVSLDLLRKNYDAVVLAYGASRDRKLGIPGEDGQKDRVGVVSAQRFVAWYNGDPGAQDLNVDLESYDRVVIVGHGNVALDCARILLTDPDVLATTDITSSALRVLRKSRIRHVEMVGRRGPLQVAFTTKELREMTKIPDLRIICDSDLVAKQCTSKEGSKYLETSRPLKRMMDLLLKHAVSDLHPAEESAQKTFTLRFLMSPLEMLFEQPKGDDLVAPQVMRFGVNRLEGSPESARAVATGEIAEIPCAMALRSIGYASTPLEGAPFDFKRHIVPNIAGRVVDDKNELVQGLYVAGWLKRGPVGVIATTMQDAYRTADAIVMDLASGNIGQENGTSRSIIDRALSDAGVDKFCVTNRDWKRLENYEFDAGRKLGKPREKVTNVEKMLDIIRNKIH
ncbi:NADPH-adrenodoxin reductase [Coemansia asiatica]|uniref:NADPH:adrenodoxin oxidoreductase, mitochondrial n=1 Tax=Coemansia asiatica TaxID=1052880 RepID=A0A9W7XJL4_9FUNG|nr:NADPH-adrenodoxin reductase [Coemansia asiatica]